MSHPENQSSLKKLVKEIVVGVLITVIAAMIIREGRFAPKPPSEQTPPAGVSQTQSVPVVTPTDAGGMPTEELISPTPLQRIETSTIGTSVQGRSIDYTRIGVGPRIIVIAGALHGFEQNTAVLVDDLKARMEDLDEGTLNDFTFYFLPRLNPDGLQTGIRFNANGVDLNRNWSTNNWQSDTEGPGETKLVVGGGGKSPFSEPETTAFSNFLLELNRKSKEQMIVFLYHSQVSGGLVQPSYRWKGQDQVSDPAALSLAQDFAARVGYSFSRTWPVEYYRITGEAINWCGEHGIACMDIELPTDQDLTPAEVQIHLDAILDVIQK